MSVLRFIQTTPTAGDCTTGYDVMTNRKHRGYTVSELIDIIRKENPDEWGSIKVRLVEHNGAHIKDIIVADYNKDGYDAKEAYEAYKDRRVHMITARGGWSAMNYLFYVYIKETT